MPSKTDDIEFAIHSALRDKALTVDEVLGLRVLAGIRAEDPRWIGAAMMHLERDGRIKYVGCDHGSHQGDCKVELA